MWGLSGTTIYRLNLTTGAVAQFPGPSGIKSGNFGAAWTFSNGNLGFSNNQTGDIYQISVANPGGTPTFGLVSHYTGPVAGTSNDGAACLAADTDLSIVKAGPASVAPGGSITWTLTVKNLGPGNSSGYAVSDQVPAGVTNVAAASPGCTVTGNAVLCSEGALTNGSSFVITLAGTAPTTYGTCFTNTATVTANENDPNTANNTSSATTCTTPGISLVKSANHTSFTAPGTPVTYSYKVTNVSTNQTLTSVGVTDPMPGLSFPVQCPNTPPTLAPLASETCTATYTTTQADVDAGGISNTGTATGTPPTGANVTAQSSLTIPAVRTPAITVLKSADIPSFSTVGTPVTFSYLVTNTGNVTLTSVGVTDPLPGLSPVTCKATTLAPLASETCTATYTTTQADLDNGSVTDTGTATGTPPLGLGPVSGQSQLVIPAVESPAITVVKSASITSFASAGVPVTYSYRVTNHGNVTLHAVGVTDPMPGLSVVTCPSSSLAPLAFETCTATYTTTQADVDAGSIFNTGTATGTSPADATVTDASSVTVAASLSPAIGLVKSASVSSFSTAGTLVTYSYLVTNTGNETLHAVQVTDPMPGLSSVNCPEPILAPLASETCTATYTTIQSDLDTGHISNTGTASGTPPTGPAVTQPSSLTIPANQHPDIGLDKTASVTDFSAVGTPVTYSYLVSNSGNVTLRNVGVSDPMPGLSAVVCPTPTLAPLAFETCTATYRTTQADLDAGGVTNTGTASGTSPSGSAVTDTSTVTVPAEQEPAITVVKTASIASFSSSGTAVTYQYAVTNTGNVTLTSVRVTDPMPGLSAVTCDTTTLAPLASETCTATYTTTQADVDAGSITNTGTASGTPASGPEVTDSSSVTVRATQSAAITVVKSANVASFSGPGTLVTYSYLVTNTGNLTLSSVQVTDPMPGLSTPDCPDAVLAPGSAETCTATYTTTQADVDAGSINNTGTASGTPPSGPDVTDTSSVTIPAAATPAIAMMKSASITTFSAPGTPVIYSYRSPTPAT